MKAFPTNVTEATGGDCWRTEYGMDLRDYFAAKAMQGLLSNERIATIDEFTVKCYRIADAMMKARKNV